MSSAIIHIADTDVTALTYKGDRVVTFGMVDQVHKRPDGTARRNFNENRERFIDGEDVVTLDQPNEIRSLGFSRPQGGTPASVVLLTRRGYLKLTKPMTDDRAWEVQGEMIDRYFAVEKQALALPDFTDPVAAARAWANEVEARMYAERTKAEIGNRREATAMNTASQAVKKANALAKQLDRSKSYATLKRMSMLYHGQEFDWRLLKRVAIEIGQPMVKVFDANYGTVNAYHADVWRAAYALEISDGGEVDAIEALVDAEGGERPLH